MSDPAQRVRDLLRLAADSGASPDEARTAAVTAARLIAQHKLSVGATSGSSSAELDRMRSVLRIMTARNASLQTQLDAALAAPPPPPPMERWIPIRAKYTSTCVTCGGRIYVGESCVYRSGHGVRCYDECGR